MLKALLLAIMKLFAYLLVLHLGITKNYQYLGVELIDTQTVS